MSLGVTDSSYVPRKLKSTFHHMQHAIQELETARAAKDPVRARRLLVDDPLRAYRRRPEEAREEDDTARRTLDKAENMEVEKPPATEDDAAADEGAPAGGGDAAQYNDTAKDDNVAQA